MGTESAQPSAQAVEEKRAFYQQRWVAEAYDQQRFGGASGARVNQRELAAVLNLLPPGGLIADIGCGTGRLSQALQERGDIVISCDASVAMLQIAFKRGVACPILADAFHLPLAPDAYGASVALRFAFHFENLLPLFTELRRVTRTAGFGVWDTYDWSARALIPLGRRFWGARVYAHASEQVITWARMAGWRLIAQERAFLFSPYLYRRLPLSAVRSLERLELVAPRKLLCRTFWKFQAIEVQSSL
ncbi:MAG: methyltransferase domain-containing protein [Chloroflexi bacterium]|nr:methyltransferase domain-containing protein [Chloroflexota bacterium]